MPRARNPENLDLPKRWKLHHGAYYYLVPPGAEKYWNHKRKFLLGKTLDEAREIFGKMMSAQESAAADEVSRAMMTAEHIAASAGLLHRAGVYFLLRGDRIVYVGRSDNIFTRIGTHVRNNRIDFDKVHTVAATGLEQERLEQLYIAAFKPEFNAYGLAETDI
jgi:hypothetical protein